MPEIHRFALVSFTPEQMFELVRDVACYPEFHPWVRGAEVHEEDGQRQLATLDVRIAGIGQRFTTENQLDRPQSLAMRLHKGNFEDLSGLWSFKPLGEIGTRVSLDLRFALPGSVLLLPFKKGFGRMADRMVDDFCRRAEVVHG